MRRGVFIGAFFCAFFRGAVRLRKLRPPNALFKSALTMRSISLSVIFFFIGVSFRGADASLKSKPSIFAVIACVPLRSSIKPHRQSVCVLPS